MPIYEFYCPYCGAVREEMKNIHDDSPEYCLSCQAEMPRAISKCSVRFSGPGWMTKTPIEGINIKQNGEYTRKKVGG